MTITYDDFEKVNIRSGVIIKAEMFPEARKPAYKVWVDFGPEYGVKQTSAQITKNYTIESLMGRPVAGVLNLGTKKIAGFNSEFLLLGFEDHKGDICLTTYDSTVPMGKRLH